MRLALGAKLIHWGELFDVYLIMDVYLSLECEFMGWAASPGSWFNLFLLFSSLPIPRKSGCDGQNGGAGRKANFQHLSLTTWADKSLKAPPVDCSF